MKNWFGMEIDEEKAIPFSSLLKEEEMTVGQQIEYAAKFTRDEKEMAHWILFLTTLLITYNESDLEELLFKQYPHFRLNTNYPRDREYWHNYAYHQLPKAVAHLEKQKQEFEAQKEDWQRKNRRSMPSGGEYIRGFFWPDVESK